MLNDMPLIVLYVPAITWENADSIYEKFDTSKYSENFSLVIYKSRGESTKVELPVEAFLFSNVAEYLLRLTAFVTNMELGK